MYCDVRCVLFVPLLCLASLCFCLISNIIVLGVALLCCVCFEMNEGLCLCLLCVGCVFVGLGVLLLCVVCLIVLCIMCYC